MSYFCRFFFLGECFADEEIYNVYLSALVGRYTKGGVYDGTREDI